MEQPATAHEAPSTPTRRRVIGFVALLAAALAGSHLHAPLFLGVDLLFGSIFALIAAYVYGPLGGVFVAAVPGVYAYFLWHHGYALLIFTAEAALVGVLARSRSARLPFADAVYWLVLGLPLVWVTYHHLLGVDAASTALVYLKQSTNGVLNALVASIVIAYTPLRRWLGRTRSELVTLQDSLFHLIATAILVPALLLMVLGGRMEMRRIEEEVTASLRGGTEVLATRIRDFRAHHLSAITALAELADRSGALEGRSTHEVQRATELLVGALPDLHNAYVAGADARTVAFHPPTNERGESTIGLDFSDRTYVAELRHTKAPVFSGVFQGRGGVTEPIVTLSVPVLAADGALRGFALGAVHLAHLARTLERGTMGGLVEASLVDGDGRVIASARPDLRPLEAFATRGRGGVVRLDDGSMRWLPEEPSMPMMARWRSAVYVRTAAAGLEPWKLIVELPLEPHIAALQRRYTSQLAVLLALSLGALLVAPLLARRLASPLARLAAVTGRIRRDIRSEDDVPWPTTQLAEVSSLVQDFRSMQDALREQVRAVDRANEELAALNAEAARVDRSKDEFLAMLGHELRNPLGAMSNALHLLRNTRSDDEATRARALAVVERQVRHQTRLVNDLLDVSRISRGAIAIDRRPLDLTELARATADDHRAALEAAGLTFTVELPREPAPVLGDPTRLAQVIGNLLHNAQKFAASGGGHVTLRVARTDGRVIVEVVDDGEGIAPELLPQIFEPFTQGDRSLDRARGGLGLGLSLVRRLVELHDGEVVAESDGPGRGARFSCSLPTTSQPIPSPKPVGDGAVGAAARRVLLVEDNPDVLESMVALLEVLGHHVDVARDGHEALTRARSLAPDVILCDLGLPGLDGYQVAESLRRDPRLDATVMIAISGYGADEDRRRSKDAGFDAHLTKPVDPDELDRTITKLRAPR
ncbi:ATP-binding protein [Myxococcota bacterium]|nr:ATP-binding protein [Myxococcota bacterium]